MENKRYELIKPFDITKNDKTQDQPPQDSSINSCSIFVKPINSLIRSEKKPKNKKRKNALLGINLQTCKTCKSGFLSLHKTRN